MHRCSILWTTIDVLWEDSMGTVHEVAQGGGGEQVDAMMLLLFALGQHPVLEALNRQLRPGELLFAYLDVMIRGLLARPGGSDFHSVGDCSVGASSDPGCTLGKLRCGIERALDLKLVISWKGEHNLSRSSSLVCGKVEMMCLQWREVSRSWAHQLAIGIRLPPAKGGSRTPTGLAGPHS